MVRDELAALRKEIKLAQNISSWRNELPVRPEVKPLVNALSEASIPVSLRTLLVEHIRELDDLSRAKKKFRFFSTLAHPILLGCFPDKPKR